MSTTTALELVSIILVVLWNAFFVAAEYAFVSVRHTRLDELAKAGSRRARMVRSMVRDPSHFISGMQLGITLSSLALGAIGEPAVSRVLEDGFGQVSSSISTTISVLLAFLMISFLHVVFGEIIPKSYTLPRAETVAMAVAGPIRLFFWLMGPFITFLDWSAQRGMRLLGIPTTDDLENLHTEHELRALLRRSRGSGVIEADEEAMLDNVFDFADTPVEDVMVPRPDVCAVPVSIGPRAAMARVLEHPYTRYPVYGTDLDDVLGVLHVRTLVTALQNGGAEAGDLSGLLRPAHMVPETKRLGDLLAEFRRERSHMAIVVDEYGSLAGIVTLEDLIEEIVGEIDDEFDTADDPVLQLSVDRVRIDGGFSIEEFNDRFVRHLPDDDFNTVGGFVFGQLGRAPQVGDTVEFDHASFEVHEVDGTRIVLVDVTFLPLPAPESEHAEEID